MTSVSAGRAAGSSPTVSSRASGSRVRTPPACWPWTRRGLDSDGDLDGDFEDMETGETHRGTLDAGETGEGSDQEEQEEEMPVHKGTNFAVPTATGQSMRIYLAKMSKIVSNLRSSIQLTNPLPELGLLRCVPFC